MCRPLQLLGSLNVLTCIWLKGERLQKCLTWLKYTTVANTHTKKSPDCPSVNVCQITLSFEHMISPCIVIAILLLALLNAPYILHYLASSSRSDSNSIWSKKCHRGRKKWNATTTTTQEVRKCQDKATGSLCWLPLCTQRDIWRVRRGTPELYRNLLCTLRILMVRFAAPRAHSNIGVPPIGRYFYALFAHIAHWLDKKKMAALFQFFRIYPRCTGTFFIRFTVISEDV